MKQRLFLRKTCSIYANDLHFATIIFPYVSKQIESGATIRTVLEKNEKENIEKIINNVGLNSEIKQKIKEIDWEESDITKIRKIFTLLEEDIKINKNIDIIVLGNNIFIQKVNRAIDLWIKNKMDIIDKENVNINVINCFSFEAENKINKILDSHDYILKTAGIEEIIAEEELLKAN